MICPFCNNNTNVYNSRLTSQKQQVWRRRRCLSCNRTFSTKERIDWTGVVTVVSIKSKSPCPYSRNRLHASIALACQPLLEQHGSVDELCDSIEKRLQQSGFFAKSPQPSEIIKSHTIDVLRAYNPIFAINYAQRIYRNNAPPDLLKDILS
jgi:transcriptional repressor NrdR